MSTVAFIEACMDAGLSFEQAKVAARVHEKISAEAENLSARQARNKRYYEARRLKASESVLNKTPADASEKRLKASESVLNSDAPRAHVRDITSTSENNHNYTLPEIGVPVCDWPIGKASDHAKLICAEMASPWLDQNKSAGLVTTVGLIDRWKRNGASWEHDVLPLIRGRLMNRRAAITSWQFFDTALGETIAANRAAMTIPEAGTVVQIRPGTGPPSFAERLSEENRQAREAAFALLDAQNG